MANELRHADVGTALSKTEWEATAGHIFNNQAAGDIMYASSTSQLSRLAIGSANQVLAVNSGASAPEWVTSVASATLAATVTVIDSTDTSSFIAMFDSATGSLAAKTDAGLTYNAGTGMLTATGLTGPLTGTASVATTVTVTDNESTAENNLIPFVANAATGTGNHGLEMDGNVYYTPSTGVITATGFAGALTGNVTGTASIATVATTVTITDNENTDEDNAVIFTAGGDVDGGNIGLESDGNLTYNPSTGRLTATQLAGAIQTASQTAITGVGTITTGTWTGTAIATAYIADNAITLAKMAHGTDGNLITYDARGAPAVVATGNDGQVLTSAGAGQPPAFEDAGGSGTFTAVAIEDLAAGDPVALVDDSGTVKVEKIRGMREHASDPKTSHDAISHVGYYSTLFHCPDVDKWARVFIAGNYYLWVQVGDYDSTTKSITWGEAVAVTDYSAYPGGGCWVGGSFDRIFVIGGRAGNDIKGWLYQINTSTNRVVTADADPLFAPGTAYTITDGDYDTSGGIFCHFATSGEAANKIIVIGTRDDGSDAKKQEIHALTPTGGSTNTVTDYIAGEFIQSTQNTGVWPGYAWNDNGTGAGLMVYGDAADSYYIKFKAFIMNDTPGWTYDTAAGSTGQETLGANQTVRTAGGDRGGTSITADTSNGNFVVWTRGASDGSASVSVVNVNPSNAAITPSGGDVVAATTIFANMSEHAAIARDFSNIGDYATDDRLPISNTGTAGIKDQNSTGVYDPDTDSHIYFYSLRMYKTHGHTEYSLAMPNAVNVVGIVTVTLSGTNDFTMTITEPDWFRQINRYGSLQPNNGVYSNNGYSLAYDTTHNQALFEVFTDTQYSNHSSSLGTDCQFLFQGTTTANKYRRSNMDKFIGFNTAAVTISSSTAATITVAGGLNENQSGLTKGAQYYIADGGTLRTTVPPTALYLYKAGIATDTSKLLVQADYMNANTS